MIDWQLMLLAVMVALPVMVVLAFAVYGAFIACVQLMIRRDKRRIARAQSLRRQHTDAGSVPRS